jgi:mono/diheme cytochrome c family protein
MTKVYVRILLFVVAITAFYMYVGQTVTQSEQHPPAELTITPEATSEELVVMGEELVKNKGGCLICHKITETGNERGPDLRGAGARAATRIAGRSAEEYLTESLVTPGAFVVEGYPPIMPAAVAPPADLSATELKAVVAFLESMGGEVTVHVTEEDVASAQAKKASAVGGTSPEVAYLTLHGCVTCHDVQGEARQVGPPLTTVAERLSEEEIRQSILDPNAMISPGYAAGLMPTTLAKDLKPEEIDQLVKYVVKLSGARAGRTFVERLGHVSAHPMLQLLSIIFIFNAGAWWAIEWIERR